MGDKCDEMNYRIMDEKELVACYLPDLRFLVLQLKFTKEPSVVAYKTAM